LTKDVAHIEFWFCVLHAPGRHLVSNGKRQDGPKEDKRGIADVDAGLDTARTIGGVYLVRLCVDGVNTGSGKSPCPRGTSAKGLTIWL
jgi:hypothetical protein